MNEEMTRIEDDITPQVERILTDVNPSFILEQAISELSRITGVPAEEGESNESSSLSGEIARMRDNERMTAIASGNTTVEQVLGIEQPNDLSPLSEEEAQILEQAVEDAHNEIPRNSGSLLVDESTSRFSSAIWYQKIQEKTITLAGVGGIGRFGNLINF